MNIMEIDIDSKRNNPLLNRTEVQFTIHHNGEGTPNREIIRGELAEKLNVKKENIIVNSINSSFGVQESTGYAKIYSSQAKAKDWDRKYILRRKKIGVEEKKKDEKVADSKKEPSEKKPEPPEEKPETVEEPPGEGETPSVDPDDCNFWGGRGGQSLCRGTVGRLLAG